MKPDYKERFLRSIGIFNESQLETLKRTPVGVAGLGLGGSIFINLVRLGFENFHIADPDIYERTNICRQRMAKETTIGKRKDDSLLEEALAINPDIKVKCFRDGVNAKNLAQFLDGMSWVVDVVDLFALPEKIALNQEARKRNIPVASCATLGFSGSVVVFNKDTPSFDELTGMKPQAPYPENLDKFLRFICPGVPEYMQNQLYKALDRSSYIPFVCPGGEISAAFCATEIAKNILGVGRRVYAPQGTFVDAFNVRTEIFEANYKVRSLDAPSGAGVKKAA